MKVIYFIYQWFIAFPILLVITMLTAIVTIIGCTFSRSSFWSYRIPSLWARIFCYITFVRVKVEGRENIDRKTSYVFVSNHQGAYDIFTIYGFLHHDFKWMMKVSLRSIPLVGFACEKAGHIMVDKSSPKRIKETMTTAEERLKGGTSLVVFPEGARTWDGNLRPFKRGAYQLAVEFGLPVVPLTIDGAFDVMPRSTYQIRPGKIKLTIHKPIFPDEAEGHNLDTLMQESYDAIQSVLPVRGGSAKKS